MRFAVSEEAAALRDAARGVLGTEGAPRPKAQANSAQRPKAQANPAWRKLGAVGAIGTLVPEDRGGLGLDENALVPLLDEIGYSGLAAPAVETIAVAAPMLDGPLVADVLAGDVVLTVQPRAGDPVPFGQFADLIVLRDGDLWRLYRRDELALEPCASVDGSRALARLIRAPEDGGLLLPEVERAWQRGVLGTAASLTGLARRMLGMTVDYVKRREQFGVPIGSFQAIKHALADALVAIEFARPMVLAAAWAQSSKAPDAALLTSAAKVRASDAARLTARTAIQCHGAMGYTTEYDLHMFAKRTWALAPSFGGAEWHRARIAPQLGLTQ